MRKQEDCGLKLATDGEFRRSFWHFDFLGLLTGVELYETEGIQFAGVKTKGVSVRVNGKLDFPSDHSDDRALQISEERSPRWRRR